MTQKEIILKLLKNNTKVTLRMLFEAGVGYTARNRIGELRKMGYEIKFTRHKIGENVSDNYYELVSEPCLPVKNSKESHPRSAPKGGDYHDNSRYNRDNDIIGSSGNHVIVSTL